MSAKAVAGSEAVSRTGRLTIVGSGMKAVAHFTQETVAHIREADIVFYKVIDGATAAFIRETNAAAVDLSQYYGDDKRRRITYIQMAEVMLREVRAGRRVVGVFYGHPGFFVDPARRALAVAAKEGYPTEMLAGVSSTDTLFADLRIDPAQNGCQTLEATDLLLRKRPVVTSGHVVILQVGSVGDATYHFAHGFRHSKRGILFDHLIGIYGPDHPSVLYLASTLPGVAPKLIRRKLGDYRDPRVLESIHPASTLYIPPRDRLETDPEMAQKLGVQWVLQPGVANRTPISDYGQQEMEAVAALERHTVSPHFRSHLASPALFDVLAKLALDPTASRAFADDPAGFLDRYPFLTEAERAALLSRDPVRITTVMATRDGKAAGSPPSDSDVSVAEPVRTPAKKPDEAPPSDSDVSVTEDAPPSDSDVSVTEDAPPSDSDVSVTETSFPPSDSDVSVTEK